MYFDRDGDKCVLNPKKVEVEDGYAFGGGMVFPYLEENAHWGIPSEVVGMGICNTFETPYRFEFYIATNEFYDEEDDGGDIDTEFYDVGEIPDELREKLVHATKNSLENI